MESRSELSPPGNDFTDRFMIYRAKPLKNSRDIRVLDIEPADSFGEPLRCSFRVINLPEAHKQVQCASHVPGDKMMSAADQYQCLSYAWEGVTAAKAILCDGRCLLIPENLESALKRIRERLKPPNAFTNTVWADAICINQVDDAEKSQQVAMMGDIYTLSHCLIIWLGEAFQSSMDNVQEALHGKVSLQGRIATLLELLDRGWVSTPLKSFK